MRVYCNLYECVNQATYKEYHRNMSGIAQPSPIKSVIEICQASYTHGKLYFTVTYGPKCSEAFCTVSKETAETILTSLIKEGYVDITNIKADESVNQSVLVIQDANSYTM